MTGQELYEHVRSLARDLDAQVWVCATCDPPKPLGRVTEDRNVFLTAPPDDPWRYLLALHELGHLASVRSWGRVPRLTEEAEAWRWAVEQSLLTPSPEEWAEIVVALESYARDRRYKRTEEYEVFRARAEALASL